MKIDFKSLYISNFMSIGEATLELNEQGFVLIDGVNENPDDAAKSNGSGKSSIFEAIVWCLTGSTIRGNKNVVNSYGNDGAIVSLEFKCDGHEYCLKRSKDHSSLKTNLLIIVDREDKSGKGIKQSEAILSEYLPDLTQSLIGSVIVLGQGLPQKFTGNTPSGRKDILEKLSKSDFMIEDLKERIANRKQSLSDELREVEDDILRTDMSIKMLHSQIEKDNAKLHELESNNDFDKEIEELRWKLSACRDCLNDDVEQLGLSDKRIAELSKSIEDLRSIESEDIDACNKTYGEKIEAQFKKLNDITSKLAILESKLSELKSIRDVCPTCGQKLHGVEKPDTASLEEELASLYEVSRSEKDVYDALVADKNNQLEYIYQCRKDRFSSLQEELATAKRNSDGFRDSIMGHRITINSIASEISKYELLKANYHKDTEALIESLKENNHALEANEDKKNKLNASKEDINIRQGIITKFNTIVTRDFRGFLLKSIIEFINKTAKEYCRYVFDNELIDISLDGNNISISYDGKEYESLSGGERQKIDLIIQFSIRDMLCKTVGFSTNVIVLDEIFDNLDSVGCNKVIDLISAKLNDVSSVFIITHHGSELSIPCDKTITVIKDSTKVSRVVA